MPSASCRPRQPRRADAAQRGGPTSAAATRPRPHFSFRGLVHLAHLSLRNFRNYAALEMPLEPGLIVLHGPNAQGKTNILEAVALLATGSSYRAASDRETIRWEAPPEDRVARITGRVRLPALDETGARIASEPNPLPGQVAAANASASAADDSGAAEATEFEVELLVADMPGLSTKRARINGAARRVVDLVGRLTMVFFGPDQLDLVIGSPHHRRAYLDTAIGQVDHGYYRATLQYNRVLQQRNQLLKQARERQVRADELLYWDEQMVEQGGAIIQGRARALLPLAELAGQEQQRLAPRRGQLSVGYDTKLFGGSADCDRLAAMPADEVQAEYRQRLALEHERELAQGSCVVGPHRDDVTLLLDGRPLERFGSRGQQRTAALALKLAELGFLRRHTGQHPVLLLDDVLSELDEDRRAALAGIMVEQEQVLFTTTEATAVPARASYEVRGGSLLRA
ncbi:MAG TPA: DNA replication and repair protein RecF [Chloroflexota bacterium]|nr:DNA replication and repair protein RecF [Chloroflexota bacterium]